MKQLYGHLGALFVVTIWGTTFVSSKTLLNAGMQPADIFFMRFVIAYICMIGISHRRLWAKNLRDELTLLGLGVMGGSLYFLTENMALMYSTSANVSILVSTTPLLTAIIVSACYSNERMTRRQVLGSLMAFAGAALVVLNGQMVLNINPLGDALAIGAAVTWALYSLFMRRVMQRYSPDFITRKVFAYGLLTILPYIIYVEEFNYSISLWKSATVVGNILFLGLLASTICYLLWNWVMRELGAVKSTNYIYLQSLITMIAGALILDERITLMGLCGALVLIIGMFYAVKK